MISEYSLLIRILVYRMSSILYFVCFHQIELVKGIEMIDCS